MMFRLLQTKLMLVFFSYAVWARSVKVHDDKYQGLHIKKIIRILESLTHFKALMIFWTQ